MIKLVHSWFPRRRSWFAVAGLMSSLALAGGVALAAGGSPNAGPVPPGEGTALATTPGSADLAAFGILRREGTSTDAFSPRSPVALSGASGANLALARRAVGFTSGEAWVVPGKGAVCLVAESTTGPNGGAACGEDSQVTLGRLMQIAHSATAPGMQFVSGLVPDGVGSVSVHLADGTVDVLPVHENVYMGEVHGTVSSVSFSGPNGPVTNG